MTHNNYPELKDKLAKFEKFRVSKYRSFKIYKVFHTVFKIIYIPAAIIAAIASFLPFLWPITLPFIIIGGVLFVIEIVLYNYVFKMPDEKFRNYFKTEIVEYAFATYFPNFKYNANSKIELNKINRANIFKDSIDLYQGEDHIIGNVEGVDIEVCEAKFETQKETLKSVLGDIALSFIDNSGDGDVSSNHISIFSGLFMIADFNKSFDGQMYVIANSALNKGIFKKRKYKGCKKLELNSEEFDKEFTAFVNNEQMGHYILTPALISRIVDLQTKFNAKIYFSFVNGTLNMAVNWGRDLLEANFSKGVSSIDDFEIILNEIKIFENIVKDLRLEHRIWGEKALV